MASTGRWTAGLIASAALLAACGSSAASSTGSPAGAGASTSSTSSTSSTTAAPAATSSAPGSSPVVLARTGGRGPMLVAASNGMSLYTFTHDTAGSGASACSGQCASVWPPLTVSGGQHPTAGAGVAGALATITRSDGTVQVTYRGLPLYFFHGDRASGDTNGVYTSWVLATP